MVVESKGEYIGVREMRKHLAWYLKGIKKASYYRNLIMRATTKAELQKILLSVT